MKTNLLLLLFLTFGIIACGDEEGSQPILPQGLTTASISDIAITTATAGGSLTSDGGAAITAQGVVWGTASNPTIALPTKTTEPLTALEFTSALTGLTPETIYFVRAYATNSVGTVYGNEQVFTTMSLPEPSVYVAAQLQSGTNRALYWKDDESFNLSNGTRHAFAKSIYVNQSGVYVAGNEHSTSSVYVAKYWKDGVEVILSDGVKHAFADGIFVSNDVVYVAGSQETTQQRRATYWVNGTQHNLTDGSKYSIASSIYVSNNDVYVAGYMNEPNEVARYWKNGGENILAQSANSVRSRAASIYVAGSDVYVAGYQQISTGGGSSKYVATVWKNNAITNLSDIANNGYASGVYIRNNDVYVCGYETNAQGKLVAKYWKNGVAVNLSDGATDEQTSSIFVTEANDVFVSGHRGDINSGFQARYWKNGVVHTNQNATYAWGIFVY
jgi:hypothetical protein